MTSAKTFSTFWVMPMDLNPFGTLFGGTMMSWMDKVAALCAMEHTQHDCVTLLVDQLRFHTPVKKEDVVDMQAEVIDEGNTSLVIKVLAKKRKSTEEFSRAILAADSIFKFVALDKDGKSTDKWLKKLRTRDLIRHSLVTKPSPDRVGLSRQNTCIDITRCEVNTLSI